MIIYIDVVFFINVILDFSLLMGISVILTRNVKIKRLIFGSFIGGISTVLIFVQINVLLNFLLKIILGLIMVIVTFGFNSFKYTFNNLFYLFALSFSVGGVAYLLIDKWYYSYIVLLFTFLVSLYFYVKMIKKYHISYSNYYRVEIIIKDRNYNLVGYLDTGNKLYDTYKHRPIVIISKKITYSLTDVIYVPYTSLNNCSVLKCLKADKIIVNNCVFKDYLIGLSNQKINIDGINCLLHSKMKGMI